jgi:hypothetical protein
MKNFPVTALRLLLGAALLLVLAACASVSVQSGTETSTAEKPARIYVAPFATARAEFNVDRDGAELAEFKKDLQNILQVAQVADISNRLLAAAPEPKHPRGEPQHAWLIQGQFVLVNQGSRLLRTTIGFGAGGTKLKTRVFVYDLARPGSPAFMTFSTTGGSNAEPGAVTSFATDPLDLAVQIALSGVSGFSHGLSEDTKRTAREITAELSNYLYSRHWIPEDKWIPPKELTDPAVSNLPN